ncbi:hypothetical protein F3I62_19100 [Pseudomonas sp. R-28-1W-6]|uniref:hypothetical protein n=1 Tax=Pseudomonas sp. R-28-1W-6 TaxID=2650101 RepID=UPI0013663168|nr:hypothetical protein [Pseudomonas sp. R-28-1W-6]MWV14214.1 hypothetical protein [Pseudomonas sp. R-28-1W-6]
MSTVTFLMYALIAWLVAFICIFLICYFENDPKFGRFNFQVAIIGAIFGTTIIPAMAVKDFATNPKKAYRQWVLGEYDN